MDVRFATAADAEAGCSVLRRSIAELCGADHGGDAASIAAWTGNKTPDNWKAWLAQAGASLFVAEHDDDIVGVGMVDGAGVIPMNYVAPGARGRGVSTALLEAMEATTARRGIAVSTLDSTRTAEPFYRARGYDPAPERGPATMAKPVA